MVASLLNFHPQRASWYHACEASWERAELATGSVAMLIFSHFFFGRNFLESVTSPRKNRADDWESTSSRAM